MAQTSSDPLVAALSEFQGSLSIEQKKKLWDQTNQKPPDANDVLIFTAEIDRANQLRRSRCVASRLQNVLQSIQQFSTVVDTFVSSNPSIAALVWGSIKVTILAASNFASFFDKLSTWFMKLHDCCPRYSEYQDLFASSTRLQKALSDFYATIIRFCTKAIEIITRKGITQAAKSFLIPFEKDFALFENDLQRQNENVREEICFASEQIADKERQLQLIERKEAAKYRNIGRRFRDDFKDYNQEQRRWKLESHERKERARRESLLNKLSTYNQILPLKQQRKKRYGKTSDWLKQTKEYQDWLAETKSSILCLSGKVGSGKTVLTASVIDDLFCNQHCGNTSIGFFFCQYDDQESLRAKIILTSLTRQFLTLDTLSKPVETCLENLSDGPLIDADDLESLLKLVLSPSHKYFITIDGFDECSTVDRELILVVLRRLLSWPELNIKVFLSSRQDANSEIRKIFPLCYRRNMECQEVDHDISTYIDVVIEDKQLKGDLVIGDPSLIHDIRSALIDGAHGMFLWVAFQIQDICSQSCDDDIRQTIGTLPADLSQTYERILERIVKTHKVEIVIKMFHWIATAKRPLSLMELRQAISIKPCQSSLKPGQFVNDIWQMIPWCMNLAILDEEEYIVQFPHHTVKEFLLSNNLSPTLQRFHIELSQVENEAGEVCVTYLSLNDFQRQLVKGSISMAALAPKSIIKTSLLNCDSQVVLKSWTKLEALWSRKKIENYDIGRQLCFAFTNDKAWKVQQMQNQYSFLAYASDYWLSHTTNFTPETSKAWHLWIKLIHEENLFIAKLWTPEEWASASNKVVSYIVKYNHIALFSQLNMDISQNADLRIQLLIDVAEMGTDQMLSTCAYRFEIDHQQALVIATRTGRINAVEKLLKISPDKRQQRFSLVLRLVTTATEDHLPLLDRLLVLQENDLLMNEALVEKAIKEHEYLITKAKLVEVVVRLEIARKSIKENRSILEVAVSMEAFSFVTGLLIAKADVEAIRTPDGCTALCAAVLKGHEDITAVLLDAGAGINTTSRFGTPLHYALLYGHVEIAKKLIARDADVNCGVNYGVPHSKSTLSPLITPLHRAASSGKEEAVKILLAAYLL